MESTKSLLQKNNFPMENYYEESFGGAKKKKKAAVEKSEAKAISIPKKTTIEDLVNQVSTSYTNGHTPIPPSKVATTASSSPEIVFAQSGQEISCDGKESILEVVQAEDIQLPYGCRMGVCGQCKLRKLEGEVTYDEKPDCEEGYILTCVAKPVNKVVILI